MKKNKSTIILILVFFVGLSVMLYPTISDYVNQRNQSRAVASYAQDVDNMTDADYSAYFDAADAFNAQVPPTKTPSTARISLPATTKRWILPARALWVTSPSPKSAWSCPSTTAPATACCRSPQAT